MMTTGLRVAAALLVFLAGTQAAPFQCIDQSGNPVDWYVFYKLGRYSAPTANNHNGSALVYLDVNKKSWTASPKNVDQPGQAVFSTLNQYYSQQNQSNIFVLMYNDEYPGPGDTSVGSSGHTKGVVASDGKTVFWLIHSIPKFPGNFSYDYPPTAYAYAQTGLCVSFPISSLTDIANQLYYTRPNVYYSVIPAAIKSAYPVLAQVAAGQYQNKAPWTRTAQLTSLGGTRWTHYAKAGGAKQDIWGSVIAPAIGSDIVVESWLHGASDNLNATCNVDGTRYSVYDTTHVNLGSTGGFDNYEDHSKYGFSFAPVGSDAGWVCIGDMNRQTSQEGRGGGALCLKDTVLNAVFRTTAGQHDQC